MEENPNIKQFVVSEQIAVEAEDAEAAVKAVIEGGGSVMSLSVNVRGAAQARPQPGVAVARPAQDKPGIVTTTPTPQQQQQTNT